MQYKYKHEILADKLSQKISDYTILLRDSKHNVNVELKEFIKLMKEIKEDILEMYPVTDEERQVDIACQVEEIKPRY